MKKRGFVLLFAVLISGVVLAIGLGIANIAIKEIIFSAVGRESQVAFYAADSGRECALYWDLNENAFATSTSNTIHCLGRPYRVGGSSGLTQIDGMELANGSCVDLTVRKGPITDIQARGHNTCNTASPKIVERGVRTVYRR